MDAKLKGVEPDDHFDVSTRPIYCHWLFNVAYLSCGQQLQPVSVNCILSSLMVSDLLSQG